MYLLLILCSSACGKHNIDLLKYVFLNVHRFADLEVRIGVDRGQMPQTSASQVKSFATANQSENRAEPKKSAASGKGKI